MAVVHCAGCGAESLAGKRFCADCGAPLGLSCSACGAAAVAGQRFCADCGTPLPGGSAPEPPVMAVNAPAAFANPVAAPAVPAVSERRMCSVLFVDLVGFTATSESRDPEDVRELLGRYFDLARTVVGRFGGTIEKFIGDAVMAVWGTPVATELDAERAVRAALDLVDSVQQLGADVGIAGLAARAGVLTGDVAVTLGATNQGMVAGDAVNTAARIQSVAEPGTVLVDSTTRRLSAGAIRYTDRGEHRLKGKSEPEHLWQAAHVVSATGGNQRVDGLEAPITGRNAELRTIREMFHASDERRQARLVLVTGPAGVGKTRLGWEFEKYADGLADDTFWHRGRCLSYGTGMAYWALAEVVRQRFQIAEDDPPGEAEIRFAEGLERWLPDAAERDFVGPRLGRLIGLPAPGDTGAALSREDLFAGWRRFFERMAHTTRVAILIEDLHYASSDLLDFLDHLVDWSRDLPIFVLTFARPEIESKRAAFGHGRNRATIALDPLDAASMNAIVDALVPGMPADARHRITDRAEGIPLYALESIRSLIDRGVIQDGEDGYRLVGGTESLGELSVPDSLRALLAARLDALDPVTRKVVGDASVLGTTFPAEAVAAVSGLDEAEASRVLADLLRREVFTVSADPLSPQRGNYGFAQEMLRQVAYDTLSRRDRKARHLAVAEHLRATFPNDGEEVVDAIARHYQDALDAAPEDPDSDHLRGQLVATLVRAAERSQRTGAHEPASESFAAAAELVVASDPRQAARLLVAAATAGGLAPDQTLTAERADRARQLAAAAGDVRLEAIAKAWLGRGLRRLGRHAEARGLLTESLTVLRTNPDLDTIDAVSALATLETFAGTPAAGPLLTELFDLANTIGVDDRRFARLLTNQALRYDTEGQRRLSELYYREAIRYGEKEGPGFDVAEAYLNLGNTLLSHDPVASIDASHRALDLIVETGATYLVGSALANLSYAHLQLDDWDPAEECLQRHPLVEHLADDNYVRVARAQLCALRGDIEGARAELSEASEGFLASEDPQDRSSVASTRALIAYAAGDAAGAAREAMECLRQVGTALSFNGDDGRLIWPLAARLAHELGRYEVEAQLLADYDAQPKGAVAPLQIAEAALIPARLAAAGEDPGAGSLFAAAIASMRKSSPPYHLAHGLLDNAAYLLGSGRETSIPPMVEEVLGIAGKLRCAPLVTRAEALSASLHQPV